MIDPRPAQMGCADVAAYVLVLAHIGPVTMTVTSTLTIKVRIWSNDEQQPV